MNIIAVDDERPALQAMERALKEAVPEDSCALFLYADEALSYAEHAPVDVAFLDIEMSGMSGLALARAMKALRKETNIIFVTAYSEYAHEAFGLRASGYLTKPVTAEALRRELDDLRNPIKDKNRGVRMQCFGVFEVFVDGKPLVFSRPRAKEILAYLVDRHGGSVDKRELATALWETKEYTRSIQSNLHILLTNMMEVLEEAGVHDLIIKNRTNYSLDTSKFTCDYYEFEQGDANALASFHGEYMKNYSWAEFTAGILVYESLQKMDGAKLDEA